MQHVRQARGSDASRLAEIEVFNYRLNFYPIFQSDSFYFQELTVENLMRKYLEDSDLLLCTYVYDDGVVKGLVRIHGEEVQKLYIEPVLQGSGIGAKLLQFAVEEKHCDHLWALNKNTRAIAFYQRHGFLLTDEKKTEEGTEEFLVKLVMQKS